MPRTILDERDLAGLATEDFVHRKIAEAQFSGEGGSLVIDDKTLKFQNGVLSVNTTSVVEEDNTRPVTSAAVHVTVGNIEALLNTI